MLNKSIEKVEKVVKPPRKPIAIQTRIFSLTIPLSNNEMQIPIKKEPKKAVRAAAHGDINLNNSRV